LSDKIAVQKGKVDMLPQTPDPDLKDAYVCGYMKPRLEMMSSSTGEKRAAIPIVSGIILLAVAYAIIVLFSAFVAALLLGVLASTVVSYVILMAMPRVAQITIMGAAIGVSSDAGYAQLNDKTPVTVATGLVKLAGSLIKSITLISNDARVNIAAVTPVFVWAFILSMAVFMLLSFLITHDG
jgi:hypothetical protein